MDIREELDLILKRIESEGVPLEQLFHDILRENFDPPPPLPSVSPPPPPPPPADSHSGGSVSYTPLGSAPPLPEHQLYGYMAAPITMQPYYVYGQPGTTSQGQLPVYNIASATTATVLPAPPPQSCAPKKQQNKQREDQAYIKKPPNAFMLYLKEQRPKVKEELSLSDSAAVNVAVGERWRSLSKEEQKKYFDEAEIQKCCHAKEHPNWSTKENYGKKRKRVRERTCTKGDAQQAKIRCVRPGQAEPSSAAIEGPHQLDRVWVCQPQTQPGVNTLTIQGTVLVQIPDTLNPVSVPVSLCNKENYYLQKK